MFTKIVAKLNKSYPLIESKLLKFIVCFGLGIFTFLFLFIYEPLGIDQIIYNNSIIVMGYATLVSLGMLISYFIVPLFFPTIFTFENWKIKHEVYFLLGSYLGITFMNYLYHNFIVKDYVSQLSFTKFLSITFFIGILPLVFLTLFMEIYMAKKLKLRQQLTLQQREKEKEIETLNQGLTNLEKIIIESDNITDANLTLPVDYILYGQSKNNYSNICYIEDGNVTQTTIRISLKKFTELLEPYEQFKRCHRSYLVNKNHIQRVEGNSRTTSIILKNTSEIIPVSRSFPKEDLVKES